MDYQYNPYFSTQSEVVYELVKVLHLHTKGKISHSEFENIVSRYIKEYSCFIFDFEGDKSKFKQFPRQKLGKKRIRIIGACLEKSKLIDDFNVEEAELIGSRFVANL